jgi:hypothetical protein
MSRERDFLDLARVNLRLAARAVKLAHEENPDRGSLSDIERLCGLHIAADNATLSEFRHRVSRRVDYGQNVVEVYLEGMS